MQLHLKTHSGPQTLSFSSIRRQVFFSRVLRGRSIFGRATRVCLAGLCVHSSYHRTSSMHSKPPLVRVGPRLRCFASRIFFYALVCQASCRLGTGFSLDAPFFVTAFQSLEQGVRTRSATEASGATARPGATSVAGDAES